MERARRIARRESSGESRVIGALEANELVEVVMEKALPRVALRDGSSWRWQEVENQQGDVVVVGRLCLDAGPATKFEQQGIREVRRGRGRSGEKFLQARLAELFARGVHCLQDSVGKEKNAVTGIERNFHRRIRSLREEAEHQAIGLDFPALGFTPTRIGARGEKHRRVAGTGVAQD